MLSTIKSGFSGTTLTSTNTSSEPESKSPRRYDELKEQLHRWTSDWITDWWAIELISWTISASSLIAIFVLLERYRGKPVPEFRFFLTINSLISIFATAGQMAMMQPIVECISQLKWLWFRKSRRLVDFQKFDDASRGPTGSLSLLGRLRCMHLVCLGAGITVASIAFGPLSQQVVTYPVHLYAVGNATVPQALAFVEASGQSEDSLSIALFAAYQAGLSGVPQNLSTVNPTCSTGNCTWDLYSSLGFCASTVDISPMLINNTCNSSALFNQISALGHEYSLLLDFPCYNYSLPLITDGTVAGEGFKDNQDIRGNATLSNLQADVWDPTRSEVNMQMLSLNTRFNNDTSLVDNIIIYQPIPTDRNWTNFPAPIALRSSVQLCVHTYNTTVAGGSTTTEIVSSELFNSSLIAEAPGGIAKLSVNGSTFGVHSDIFKLWLETGAPIAPDACYYVTGPDSPANFSTSQSQIGCLSTTGAAFNIQLQNSIDPVSSVNTLMKNIAISFSNSFREGAGGNTITQNVQGTAYLPVAFVEAKYVWLTLPIGLVLLTFIFLLATIIQTRGLGARNWKSSNFTTLQGLHPSLSEELGGLESLSSMDEKVEEIMVRLMDAKADRKKSGAGWRLVRVD